MGHSSHRARRTLPRGSSSSVNKSMVNAALLIVALAIILLSRCEPDQKPEHTQGSWVDYLITPKHLRLPKSVIDVQQERARSTQHQLAPVDLGKTMKPPTSSDRSEGQPQKSDAESMISK